MIVGMTLSTLFVVLIGAALLGGGISRWLGRVGPTFMPPWFPLGSGMLLLLWGASRIVVHAG